MPIARIPTPAQAADSETRTPDRVAAVEARLRVACEQAGRARETVTLVAVSKTRTASELRSAHAAGLRDFGENYLQEAREKQAQLIDLPLRWHFIGPIQSNKTRTIAEHFDLVHSVDRERIARRLSDQRPRERGALPVFVQVDIDDEASKSGVPATAVAELARTITTLPGLSLAGLMAIPRPGDAAAVGAAFERLAGLAGGLPEGHRGLSMGMSADFELAIGLGATHVRIGSALFGPRPARPAHSPS